MIRILYLAQLPPPVHGASLMSRYLLHGLLSDPNYQIDAVNISTADSLMGLGRPSVRKLVRMLSLVLRVFSSLVRHHFDLVYITLTPTGSAFFKDALLLALAKLFVRRRIIHLHGKGIQTELVRSALRRILYRRVFSGCEVVHLSQGLLADLEGLPCTARHVIPNGVPAQQTGTQRDKKYDFIYLSNLVETKGIYVFLEALGRLKAAGIVFRAAVVGAAGGPEVESKVEFLVLQHELGEYVALLGPKYEKEKYAVLEESRIFVLPTFFKNECFPLSILEAMSVGLPVVSTNEGAIAEIIEDSKCGILVERRSSESLANALKSVLEAPDEVTKMSGMARYSYSKKYSIDIFISNMSHLLSQQSSTEKSL